MKRSSRRRTSATAGASAAGDAAGVGVAGRGGADPPAGADFDDPEGGAALAEQRVQDGGEGAVVGGVDEAVEPATHFGNGGVQRRGRGVGGRGDGGDANLDAV